METLRHIMIIIYPKDASKVQMELLDIMTMKKEDPTVELKAFVNQVAKHENVTYLSFFYF